MCADQTTGIGYCSDLSPEIGTTLPKARNVERQTVPVRESSKVDVHRSTSSFPASFCLLESAHWICLQVGDIEEVKCHSFFGQRGSCSTPISEQIRSGVTLISNSFAEVLTRRTLRKHYAHTA